MSARLKHILSALAIAILLALPGLAATPAQAAAPLSIQAAPHTVKVTKAPGSVSRGRTASVTVRAWSQASCSITVRYKSGPSRAQGLYTKKAGTSGLVSWSWKVGTNTTRGSWPVIVTCEGISTSTAVRVP